MIEKGRTSPEISNGSIGHDIVIHVDPGGAVTISDLPLELTEMIKALGNTKD